MNTGTRGPALPLSREQKHSCHGEAPGYHPPSSPGSGWAQADAISYTIDSDLHLASSFAGRT